MVTAVLGATLLPFWPPLLVAAIALAAGLACWVDPRAGLALALAAAVFPLGNAAAERGCRLRRLRARLARPDLARRTPRAPLRLRPAARSPRPASARPPRRAARAGNRPQGGTRRARRPLGVAAGDYVGRPCESRNQPAQHARGHGARCVERGSRQHVPHDLDPGDGRRRRASSLGASSRPVRQWARSDSC